MDTFTCGASLSRGGSLNGERIGSLHTLCECLVIRKPYLALVAAEEAYWLSKTEDERSLLLSAWKLGECHRIYRNYSRAVRYLTEAYALLARAELPAHVHASVCFSLGRTYHMIGEYGRAQEIYRESIEYGRMAGGRECARRVLLLGDACRKGGDHAAALEAIRESCEVLKAMGETSVLGTMERPIDLLFEQLFEILDDRGHPGDIVSEWHAIYASGLTPTIPGEKGRPAGAMMRARKGDDMSRELDQKTRELKATSLELARANEFIGSLREKIGELAKASEVDSSEAVSTLLRQLDAYSNGNAEWRMFERQFDRVDHAFIHTLSERCPKLSPAELRICALLRINLSSKEIADFLCTTVRTVEKHRQHIRKKLNISNETNLSVFLASL